MAIAAMLAQAKTSSAAAEDPSPYHRTTFILLLAMACIRALRGALLVQGVFAWLIATTYGQPFRTKDETAVHAASFRLGSGTSVASQSSKAEAEALFDVGPLHRLQ